MSLLDVFIGVPQSKYAAVALLVAVIAVGLYILLGKSQLSTGDKFIGILIGVLLLLPYVLLNLFQLTCIVSGKGARNENWWCGIFAWIVSVFVIIYSAFLVIAIVIAILTDGKVNALEQFRNKERFADMLAKDMLEKSDEKKDGSVIPGLVAPPAALAVPPANFPIPPSAIPSSGNKIEPFAGDMPVEGSVELPVKKEPIVPPMANVSNMLPQAPTATAPVVAHEATEPFVGSCGAPY